MIISITITTIITTTTTTTITVTITITIVTIITATQGTSHLTLRLDQTARDDWDCYTYMITRIVIVFIKLV